MDFWWIVVIAFFAVALVVVCGNKSRFQISPPIREGYRDPIYLNVDKMVNDWYPRSNGSVYGFNRMYGGSWNIFTGYPYYDKAY
uniref:Uncharacterized protein n=1 Tax=Marseillevirus LCMAC101 TaxID=2506602 RepID=A0A481YRQ4_9VIRU|nr:MAG: hypothetical protein LCMAC101_04770 [Marseillevirus LCMAC101]